MCDLYFQVQKVVALISSLSFSASNFYYDVKLTKTTFSYIGWQQ
jgi:hypothetical protein